MATVPIKTLIMAGTPSSGFSGYSGAGTSGYSGFSGVTPGPVTWRTESSSNATLQLTDAQNGIIMTSSSPQSVTIPTNVTVAFPIGSSVLIVSYGTGLITVAAAVGVTLNYRSSLTAVLKGQYSAATVVKTGTDTWVLMGDIGG